MEMDLLYVNSLEDEPHAGDASNLSNYKFY